MSRPNILLVTKGHPFDHNAFFEIFDSIEVDWTHVEQPAAKLFFSPENAKNFDAFVMYDMPGIKFKKGGPEFEVPSEQYKSNFLELLASGKGMVFLHHAIAGWPTWPEYSEIIGGRFLYLPGVVKDQHKPDSGYRHKVNHEIKGLREHRLTEGLPPSFSMTDELYLSEIFEDEITPLFSSNYTFSEQNFYSAQKAAVDRKMNDNDGWSHDDTPNIVGWVKRYLRSPIAYLQGGDDPEAYANENFRKMIENAIHWAASEEALVWSNEKSQV